MKRLTVSESYCLAKECSLADKDGTCVLEMSKNCYDKRLHDKLREYEDLEEQVLKSTGTDLANMVGEFMHYYNLKKENRLLELPCKVGDELFVLDDRKTIHPFILEDIEINQCGLYILIAYNGNKEYLQFWKIRTPIENIHKTVFLTKEEAEAALAEMEKNDE